MLGLTLREPAHLSRSPLGCSFCGVQLSHVRRRAGLELDRLQSAGNQHVQWADDAVEGVHARILSAFLT